MGYINTPARVKTDHRQLRYHCMHDPQKVDKVRVAPTRDPVPSKKTESSVADLMSITSVLPKPCEACA
jgi:hypothetical protein